MKAWTFSVLCAVLLLVFASETQAADTVICFGDSITAGYKGGTATAYPTYLQPMLDAASFTVVNAGKGGEDTYSGVSRMASVLDAYQPRYVIIMEGTNDVMERISPATTSFNVKNMAEQAKAAGAVVIMSTIPPNFRDSYTPENYNPLIVQAASDGGITLVDTYSRLINDWASLTFDDIHPNSDGAYVIAEGFASKLTSVKSSQDSSDGGGSSGCFIATAAYGTALEHQVILLKRFRDLKLLTNAPGRAFVKFYYRHSPPLAAFIARHETVRLAVRMGLLPLLAIAWLTVEASALQQTIVLLAAFSLLTAAVWIRRRRTTKAV